MTTQNEIIEKLDLTADQTVKVKEAYEDVLVSQGEQDITLYDGTTTPNLNKRLAGIVQAVKSVNGKDGEVNITRDDLNIPSDEQLARQKKEDRFVITESGRTQREKNKDCITTKDFGAICDGIYHPLSVFFKTLQDAQVKYSFVTSLEQSIDDVALQQALNDASVSQVVYVDGQHVSYSLNTSSSDPVIVNTVAYRKLVFRGVLLAGNDLKRFISVDAPYCEVTIKCDGKGVGLNNILRITQPYCKIINGLYENIYSKEFGAGAISITAKGYGFTISGNVVRNLSAKGNSSYGDGNGMCRAVAVDLLDPPEPSVIENNYFDHITGEEGDIITIVANSANGGLSNAKVVVKNNRLGNANRRYVKVQANGVSVSNNYFFANDRSISMTPIRNCVDFVTGSGHEVVDNIFDSVIDFTQISVYQSDSTTPQNRIRIKGNRFLGLNVAEHTKTAISLASPSAQNYIIKDNYITCGVNASIAVGGAGKVLLADNEFEVVDYESNAVVVFTSAVGQAVASNNTLIQGSRLCFFSDVSSGTVYKDNINLTTTPMVRLGSDNLKAKLLNNINFSSGLTSGSTYRGSYIYSNFRCDETAQPYLAPMYITGATPSGILNDAYVSKGQILYTTATATGSPIGYTALESGKATEITWRGFGVIL